MAKIEPEPLKSLLLGVRDENFEELLELIRYVNNLLKAKNDVRLPRLFPPAPNYAELLPKAELPQKQTPTKEVLDKAVAAFEGLIRWQHPYALHNITPPPLLSSVAIGCMLDLYNPNCLWDFVSGQFLRFEQDVVRYIAQLCNWDDEAAGGIFTFGGKATLTYAIKIGMNKCSRQTVSDGVNGHRMVVITSKECHYTIESVCNLLGIGSNNCIRVPTDERGVMRVNEFRKTLHQELTAENEIACIVLSGGTSLNNSIDPISDVREVIAEMSQEFSLASPPHLHVDSVVGWLWLFFRYYDFLSNPLTIAEPVARLIQEACDRISLISQADSAGVDFHKNAFCPYVSSLFAIKDKKELHSIHSDQLREVPVVEYGGNFVQHYSIEHSRSGEGIISAWIAINTLGVEGFQKYVSQMMDVVHRMRQGIESDEYRLVNPQGLGFATLVQPIYPEDKTLGDGSSNEPLIKYQRYCLGLFQYLSASQIGDATIKPLLGFIPDYKFGTAGVQIPVLRIYPMSPHLTVDLIDEFIVVMKRCKRDYDSLLSGADSLERDSEISSLYPR